MKKLLFLILFLLFSITALAQTPTEVMQYKITSMETSLEKLTACQTDVKDRVVKLESDISYIKQSLTLIQEQTKGDFKELIYMALAALLGVGGTYSAGQVVKKRRNGNA